MIRIALLLASKGAAVGGMEKQVALQANYLQREPNVEVHVLAHKDYACLFETSVHFHPLATQRSRHSLRLQRDLSKQLATLTPDLVHAHGDKATVLLSKVRKAIPQSRLFATVHGTKRPLRALHSMNKVLAVSDGVSEALKPIKSSVIGNAIEAYQGHCTSKVELCARFKLNPDWPLAIAVGRLAPVKCYDVLMKAFDGLEANLLIFGDGPMKRELEALELSHVRLAGFADPVQAMFSAADVLIINSEREGLSLSMLEALQAGLPVISTPVSGAKSLLPKECLLNPGQALAPQLAEKLARPELLTEACAPAIQHVKDECRLDQLVARLLKHYHCALELADTQPV